MNFVFVTLLDVANISNIYINLCLSVCDYFGFRFFFLVEKSLFLVGV